jgi:PTS system cellobiose-specific IIC component
MGTNIMTVLILGLVANFLWVLGIHGPNTVAAIRETIFSEANLENLSYAASHGTTWGRLIRLPGPASTMRLPTAAARG